MSQNSDANQLDFWGHLDELRGVIIKAAIIIVALACLFFANMTWLFDNVILAPCSPDFPLFRLLSRIAGVSPIMPAEISATEDISLINTQLASQFFIHISTSLWMAVIAAFPAIIYLIWSFIAPALYPEEKRGAARAFLTGICMFYLGVAVGYFLVFPLTLRFLAEYHVSASVVNLLSLDSYMDNFLALILIMGIIFELPLVAWMLGRAGILKRSFFARYRRHAIVALLFLAAVVTPTGDPFTLLVVFTPIYLLWEGSAWLVPQANPNA